MSTSKVVLGTLAGLIATASSCYATPAPNVSAVAEDGGYGVLRLSDAARKQILDKSTLQLAVIKRPFTQENGPTFVQWRAQQKSMGENSRPASAGYVRVAFEQARSLIG